MYGATYVEKSSEQAVDPEELQIAMVALAKTLQALPISENYRRWTADDLTWTQLRAIYEHSKAGRVTYNSVKEDPLEIWVQPLPKLGEWYVANRNVMTRPAEPPSVSPQLNLEAELERMSLAAGDKLTLKIMEVANHAEYSGEEKFRMICRLDERMAGKSSSQWAALLKVSAAAVRGYDAWKQSRKSNPDYKRRE